MAKKHLILCVLLAILISFIFPSFSAAGDSLQQTFSAKVPNPGIFYLSAGILSGTHETDGRQYELWIYNRPDGWKDALKQWNVACSDAGLTVESGVTDGKNIYIVSDGEKQAVFVPEYSKTGSLLMLETGMMMGEDYIDPTPTPEVLLPDLTETPHGHWTLENQITKITCWYCKGRKWCPICKDTGHYRNPYTGEQMTCDIIGCPTCDGEGYIEQVNTIRVWVPDE